MPGGLNGVPCLVLGGGGFLGRALLKRGQNA
jgi:nucleoside-diphosphate-sugar epimerase